MSFEFSDIIVNGTNVRSVTCGELFIRLSDDNPVVQSPYRLSFYERAIVADLIQNNIIQESVSPYASPITLVTKKNGQSRMCVDFWALNKITVKNRYPLPLIDDQLDALATANWFTALDMASGFHQIPKYQLLFQKPLLLHHRSTL